MAGLEHAWRLRTPRRGGRPCGADGVTRRRLLPPATLTARPSNIDGSREGEAGEGEPGEHRHRPRHARRHPPPRRSPSRSRSPSRAAGPAAAAAAAAAAAGGWATAPSSFPGAPEGAPADPEAPAGAIGRAPASRMATSPEAVIPALTASATRSTRSESSPDTGSSRSATSPAMNDRTTSRSRSSRREEVEVGTCRSLRVPHRRSGIPGRTLIRTLVLCPLPLGPIYPGSRATGGRAEHDGKERRRGPP